MYIININIPTLHIVIIISLSDTHVHMHITYNIWISICCFVYDKNGSNAAFNDTESESSAHMNKQFNLKTLRILTGLFMLSIFIASCYHIIHNYFIIHTNLLPATAQFYLNFLQESENHVSTSLDMVWTRSGETKVLAEATKHSLLGNPNNPASLQVN